MMASFDYNYHNPSVFLFVMLIIAIVELFFCKKIPLSRRVEYVMDGSTG